jgi:hypothetical protein
MHEIKWVVAVLSPHEDIADHYFGMTIKNRCAATTFVPHLN